MSDTENEEQAPAQAAPPEQQPQSQRQEDTPRMRARVWRIARPLVNTTMGLCIVLLLVMIWFVHSAQSFFDDVMHKVKFDVIEEVDTDIKALADAMRAGVDELDSLQTKLTTLVERPADQLGDEMRKDIVAIRKDTQRIADDLDRMASGHIDLSQDTLEKVSAALVHAYGEIRGCTAPSEPREGQSAAASGPVPKGG